MKLEREKQLLLTEAKSLKAKALQGWTRMSRKQVSSLLLLGIVLTALTISFPLLVLNPLVTRIAPLSTLSDEPQFISYLREVQESSYVYLGVHGFTHKCPICGANDHELACPNDPDPNASYMEIDRRIRAGFEVFNACALRVDWYCFPGEAYDNRAISVLKTLGLTKVDGLWTNASSMQLDPQTPFKEYTWMWRETVSKGLFETTLITLQQNSPVEVIVHVQDLTRQTYDLLEFAILYANTTVIRCDDVTPNDLGKIEEIVNFATEHHIKLLLAVTPAFEKSGPSFVDPIFEATWIAFTGLFVFPLVVMIPWAAIFKLKKQKPFPFWNPHYPTVSLILPAYNEEETIAKSIRQGLKQDYKGKIEIIVVDDGSTDKTNKIAKKYAARYSNVKVLSHGKNKGKSEALNTGFSEARGEVCVFSDTDSVLASDALSKLVAHFKDPEVGMVAGMVIVGNEKNLLTRLQQIEYLLNQTVIRFCQSSHKNVLICPGACAAIRTQIARKIMVKDRTITEDADFTFSVWKEGWKISQEPDSISYTEVPESLKSLINQRKRWMYGGLQTMSLHKWAVKKMNIWVIKAWLECFLSPLTLLTFAFLPLLYLFSGPSLLLSSFTYGILPLVVLAVVGAAGVRLYNKGEKSKLAFLLPFYVLYQVVLNFLMIYLVFAFVSRRGIHIRFGGKIVHAI